MLPFQDILILIGIALAAATGVTVAGLAALRLTRRSSMLVQLGVVSVSGLLSVALGVVLASSAMYVSAHDLSVVLTMAAISGVVSLGTAVLLGLAFTRRSAELADIARALGDGSQAAEAGSSGASTGASPGRERPGLPGAADSAELARLASELDLAGHRLTESRAATAAAEDARRALVAHVSHDLRTPLAGIRAMAEALEDGLVEDPARYYRLMRGQVASLTTMVDDLFELSRIQAGALRLHLEPISVADLVSDAVGELQAVADRQQVDLRAHGEPSSPIIIGDDRELSRAIANLLVNAVQHTPPGGAVDVAAEEQAGQLTLSVTNTGSGIRSDDLERVFDAGWRGDPARTATIDGLTGGGLGLAIVRGIVEAHGGTVVARNVPGGCRFDIRLPCGRPHD